ncbi:MAG TPA: hydroxysqualene dehydroxylase HpnE [Vicinamibacterales bacterium]|nr:hydroxysqualene dehydroxylase HpnE [Vicinamibacterales bacterium]
MPAPDVVIIGGGLAGLSAAVELTERGARVRVLEARPALGGRATAFVDPRTGEPVDNGQHVLAGCYHETFAFLERLGTADRVDLDESLDIEFVDRRGVSSRLRSALLPAPWHLVGGLLRWRALSWRDRVTAVRLGRVLAGLDRSSSADDARMNEATVREWLARHGQTDRLNEMLWEPLAIATLNQPASEASAAPFVAVLRRMFSGPRRNAAIGLPRVPLDELYARPAARWLEARGGVVSTNAPARIVCERDRLSHVEVRGERVESAAVICAVPWHALSRTVAPPPPAMDETLRRADAMESSPIVTVNLWLDRPVTSVPFVGLPGRTIQWVFDKRRAFGERASHLSLVSSGASAIVAESNDALVDLALREIQDALPAARTARVLRASVVREKRATFSLAPGQPPRPSVETPVRGLWLAGDWIDTGLPATIESAVLSGRLAADAAARAC